jgi:hypothetical protein
MMKGEAACTASPAKPGGKMNLRPACTILLSLLIGTAVGSGLGLVNGDMVRGMQLGAMAGLFIGWILTAATLDQKKN